jgi:hypothetical protein
VSIFTQATDDLFSDENMASPAIYRVGGSGPQLTIRVIFSVQVRDMPFGNSGVAAREIIARVRLSEIAVPKRGDTLQIDATTYRIEQTFPDSLALTAELTLSRL